LNDIFTRDIETAVKDAEYIIIGTAHKMYFEEKDQILAKAKALKGILDACNTYRNGDITSVKYVGIGRGTKAPEKDFVNFVYDSFRAFETGLANEVNNLCDFLNQKYADGEFNRVKFSEVQRLGASCSTGCIIADTGKISSVPVYKGFSSRLAQDAFQAQNMKSVVEL
jgi:hypothetical protein